MAVPIFDETYREHLRLRFASEALWAERRRQRDQTRRTVARGRPERGMTPYEVLRERFVTGFYTFEEFERYVGQMLEGDAA